MSSNVNIVAFRNHELNHDSFPPEVLQRTLTQISHALFEHGKWHSAFIRSIICNLSAKQVDNFPLSHTSCKFGLWFYGETNEIPNTHPRYIGIDLKHKAMHQLATKLLTEVQSNGSVSVLSYDKFSHALEKFQAELIEFERELENLLYQHDSLTGANTRLGLLPTLKEFQELMKREPKSHCCIVMMDLDKFKDVNDAYGHRAGDKVLSTIIHYITEQLRPYDSIYRYGGEEFVILMKHTDLQTGYNIVERLRNEIETLPIYIERGELIHITASFGLVALDANEEIEKLIELADLAMYEAKAAGRNCVKIKETTPNKKLYG